MNTSAAVRQTPVQSDKARLRLWIRLLRTTRQIENTLRDRLRLEFSETMPRFDVMAALYRQPGGIKMSELSRSLMVSNGNVTPIIEKLVQSGLVHRNQPPNDRRSLIVQLSPTGTIHFESMAKRHQSWVEELLAGLSDEGVTELGDQLARISVVNPPAGHRSSINDAASNESISKRL